MWKMKGRRSQKFIKAAIVVKTMHSIQEKEVMPKNSFPFSEVCFASCKLEKVQDALRPNKTKKDCKAPAALSPSLNAL